MQTMSMTATATCTMNVESFAPNFQFLLSLKKISVVLARIAENGSDSRSVVDAGGALVAKKPSR